MHWCLIYDFLLGFVKLHNRLSTGEEMSREGMREAVSCILLAWLFSFFQRSYLCVLCIMLLDIMRCWSFLGSLELGGTLRLFSLPYTNDHYVIISSSFAAGHWTNWSQRKESNELGHRLNEKGSSSDTQVNPQQSQKPKTLAWIQGY